MKSLHAAALMLLAGVLLAGCASVGSGPTGQVLPRDRGSLLDTARAQIGTPYHRAGESPVTGFDCSGFVQWVYARHGVRLPRSTNDQLHAGHPVDKSQMRAGDLVFFMPSGKSSSLHVGIFDGHGGFIHSPSPGGRVREESLLAPYWRSSYYTANRVLP